MTRKRKDKFLIVDSDSAIYACCFICVKKEHFASIKGKLVYASKDKRKYNKWFKEQSPVDQACIDYTFTEETLPFSEAKIAFDGWLKKLTALAGCDRRVLLLTKGGSCFRTYRATLKKYKGNRDNLVKPPYYDELRTHLVTKHKAKTYQKWEADDTACMSMAVSNAKPDTIAILAAIDKDLEQQEGRHINPNKKAEGVYVVDSFTGWYSFYKQMIMGDVADNILGIPGVGEKKAIKLLEPCKTINDLFQVTWDAYRKKYGDGHTYCPWWWDENIKHTNSEGEQVSKYFDKDYFDAELCEKLRELRPNKAVQCSVEDVFYENADLLYMLRNPHDQYHAHVTKKSEFNVREDYPTGIVDAMLDDRGT